MSHTPGPWKIYQTQRNKKINQDESFIFSDRPYPQGACIAIVREGELFGELEGNAHLIAAAPELYAIAARLDHALRMLPELPDTISLLDMEQLHNAITKAEGRS